MQMIQNKSIRELYAEISTSDGIIYAGDSLFVHISTLPEASAVLDLKGYEIKNGVLCIYL